MTQVNNISKKTYDLIKDQFNCIYRGKIAMKNKGMIDMYFVTSAKEEITTLTKENEDAY